VLPVGWRDELRRHFACRAECGIVEDGEILLDRTAGRIRWQTRGTSTRLRSLASAWIKAGIDGKALTADQSLVDAALQHCLEQTSRRSLSRKRRGGSSRMSNVRHRAVEPKPAKPAVREFR